MTHKITPHQIFLTQGDTLRIPIHFNQDITGSTVHMQVRDSSTDSVIIDTTTTDHLDAIKGDTMLTITSKQSNIPVGKYHTDMSITFSDGTHYTFYPAKVGCIGKFIITKQITLEDSYGG